MSLDLSKALLLFAIFQVVFFLAKHLVSLSRKNTELSIDLARADKHDLTGFVKELQDILKPFADAGSEVLKIHEASIKNGGPSLENQSFGLGLDFKELTGARRFFLEKVEPLSKVKA